MVLDVPFGRVASSGCCHNLERSPLLKLWPRETSLADHKFKVGQTVDYSPGRRDMPAMSRLYKVVRLLPPEDGQLLYRIKGSSEPFERVAREQDLSRP